MKKQFTLVIIFCFACLTGFSQSVTITPDSPRMIVKGPASQQGLDLSTNDQYLNARVLQNTNSTFDKDMFLGYQSGATSALHLFSNNTEVMTIRNGNIGVYNTNPSGLLHFDDGLRTRKIVLYDEGDNDNVFAGFGINAGMMRYQVEKTTTSHVFFAGVNTTTSNELMRIKGNGNVGIGTSTPNAQLQLSNSAANRKIVLYEDVNNDHEFSGFGINNFILRYQVGTTIGNHVFYAGTSATTSNELMRIQGDGRVGIGTSTPHARLQLANGLTNRTMILWEDNDNDHQFHGLGINQDILRYQVANTSANHVFYAGTSATTSNELMRIQGDGRVGIQNANPSAPLHFANVLRHKKIVLYEDADNDHQFVGLGVNSGEYRYQTNRLGSAHVFYAGINSTSSLELMRIHGDGKVSIGTNVNTGDKLKVYAAAQSSIKIESGDNTFAGIRTKNSLREYFTGINGGTDRWCVYDNNVFLERLTLLPNGNMGIGTNSPDNKLDVLGTIRANEVIIESGWADYVFDEGFKLKTLNEVENYIKENKHLPDVPSAKEVQEKGAHVSDLMTKMMQKIEELTLYSIAQQKRIEALEKRLNDK